MKKESIILSISIIITILVLGFALRASYTPEDKTLGSSLATGDYVKKTTSDNSVISAKPVVLHKIIFSTANDSTCIADSASSSSGCMNITATVPQTFDFETIFVNGLAANTTSTTGVLFVTSPQ